MAVGVSFGGGDITAGTTTALGIGLQNMPEGLAVAGVLAGIGYFAVSKDMIPDKIPGIGFLDDALMAELVTRDLKPELDGYRSFCEYRDNEATLRGNKDVTREDWLEAKRRQIWLRIKRRQNERQHRSRYSPTPSILRYR